MHTHGCGRDATFNHGTHAGVEEMPRSTIAHMWVWRRCHLQPVHTRCGGDATFNQCTHVGVKEKPPSTTAHTQVWRRCHLLSCFSPELSVCFKPLCFGTETSGLVDSGLPLLARGYATNLREQGALRPSRGRRWWPQLSECLPVPLSHLELHEAWSSRVTPSRWDSGTLTKWP